MITMHISLHISFYLWSISLPGNNGTPRFDLSQDECCHVSPESLTSQQILIERVIKKTFCTDYMVEMVCHVSHLYCHDLDGVEYL